MNEKNTFKPFTVETMNFEQEDKWFRRRLKLQNISDNTVESYCWTVRSYLKLYNGVVSPDNLINYKVKMLDTIAPASVNCRIHGINKYLNEKGLNFHLKTVRVVPKQYLENVISKTDYKHLKRMLKRDDKMFYFLITGMATSGARISEILTLRVEHVYECMFSVYGKGAKHRTLFLTNAFQKECMAWLEEINRKDGFVFSENGVIPLTAAQVRDRLQKYADKYHIAKNVMHPHGFRHLFGKMYMQNGGDIVTLASIMGHSSIETTKRYLLVSLEEARAQYNRIVNW